MESGDFYSGISLALDTTGRPCISYSYSLGYALKYAAWDGSNWQIQNLINSSATGPSLCLDSSNNPHISYYDGLNQNVKYAVWDESAWQYQIVDGVGEGGASTLLALDSSGNPSISYLDRSIYPYILNSALWNGSAWYIEVIGTAEKQSSFILDSTNKPYILYWGEYGIGSPGGLYEELDCVYKDGSTWQMKIVDNVSDYFSNTTSSMAIDSSNKPCIVYANRSNIKYAAWDGASWQIQNVNSYLGSLYCSTISLALDSNDKPHIAYYDDGDECLKYAFWDGSTWQTQTIVNLITHNPLHIVNFSLKLDSLNKPHIVYSNGYNQRLEYASLVPEPSMLILLSTAVVALLLKKLLKI